MPLISIITPSFNQAAYLEATILSVLNQNVSELEYIIIDGGSTDGSIEIIKRYINRLAYWVSEPDQGQAEALNKGFKLAKGEYIAWLNSDDLYLPGAIRSAINVLESQPELGMVFGDAITIDIQGKPLNKLSFKNWRLEDLMSFRIICQPAVYMRRSVLIEAGYLDTSFHFMLDHHLWLRMARLAPIQHIPHIWAAARHHPTAKNVAQASEFGKETMRILEWMQTQPDLMPIIEQDRRRIFGGAHRLNARYLLDGDQPAAALLEYGRALISDPGYALQHWHRMIYAIFSIFGAGGLAKKFQGAKIAHRNWQEVLSDAPELGDWPGLNLNREYP